MVSKLEKLGVISVCLIAINLARVAFNYWEKKTISRCCERINLRSLGQWGVVTGADKTLGRTYAVELAKRGLNVVLVGEESSKLCNLSKLLEKYFQVFTGVILLVYTLDKFDYVEKVLKNLDIAVLVNAPDFAKTSIQPENPLQTSEMVSLTSEINRNLTILTKMCAIVAPGMVSKGKGIIVNVVSPDSDSSCPFLALYKASTAYVEKLSQELRNAYSCSGVIIQSVLPDCMPSRRFDEETCSSAPDSTFCNLKLWIKEFCSETTSSINRMIENVKHGATVQS